MFPAGTSPGRERSIIQTSFAKLGALKYGGYVAMEFLPTGDNLAILRAAREMVLRAARS
jgi:hypothetical protein